VRGCIFGGSSGRAQLRESASIKYNEMGEECIMFREKRNAYTNVINLKEKCCICRLGPKCEDNIQMVLWKEDMMMWTGSG
jgi:hypothetical protein